MSDELQAGRELDALVAERVMGWRWFRRQRMKLSCCMKPEPIGEPTRFLAASAPFGLYDDYSDATGDEAVNESFMESVPRYSTDIRAAWDVVEHFRTLGNTVSVNAGSTGDWWCVVYLDRSAAGFVETEYVTTAPLAICRAALMVAGAEAAHAA